MKNLQIFLLIFCALFLSFVFSGCSDPTEEEDVNDGNWIRVTPFRGNPRAGAVVFTIGSDAFVGLGYDGEDYLTDFYSYNADEGFWEVRQSFPGTPRERAVAFSIGNKGYIGIGYNRDETTEELNDFWEYDPDADTWTRVADFKGSARYNAVAFAIDSKGYVGTGYDGKNYCADFYRYDPSENTWTEIISYPGNKREEAVAFSLNGLGYVCAGRNNGAFDTDFWQYDPTTALWTKRTPDDEEDYYDEFTLAVSRYDAVAFVMNEKAYIASGYTTAVLNNVYEYDPVTSAWQSKTGFEGSARSSALAFVLNNRAFVGTGQSGTRRFDDIWEFNPDDTYEDND